jgi:hypothetical protein
MTTETQAVGNSVGKTPLREIEKLATSTQQHTPGPWIAHNENINHEGNKAEYEIASCTRSPVPTPEAYANACLIAAAPDLLAACKLAMNHFSGWHSGEYDAQKNIIRAAISRAEGR